MPRCAFLSMAGLTAYECYDHLLFAPLAARGWQAEEIDWRDTSVDWNTFDVVLIRSTWDYQKSPEQFMAVLEDIEHSSAQLENSLSIVRWNLNKTYLKEVQSHGIPIVPTLWKEKLSRGDIAAFQHEFHTDKLILKPVISANADSTFLVGKQTGRSLETVLLSTFEGRPLMIQPFMQHIISEGEFSLFYFGGVYSHAILKTPAKGDFRVQEEHGGKLKTIAPPSRLKKLGDRTIQTLPEIPLYARVDFVRTDEDNFALMELELIEPSLYFNMDPASPARFVSCFDRMMSQKV